MSRETIVIALGGNALLQKGQKGTFEEQLRNARVAARQIVKLVKLGYRIVVTHGNGPQVGAILLQQEAAKDIVPPMPLDACGAMSQGLIGYIIQQSLYNELRREGLSIPVATIVTQTIVRKDDPAFKNPTKFIGPYYSEEEAKRLMKEKGWVMKPDPRGGWRRVVPSPDPVGHIEIEAIKRLVDAGVIVIASGGGGIPVIEENGEYRGVEAVIDKDLAAERLATALRADILMILTDVEKVALNYGKPNQKFIDVMTVSEAKKYYEEGHFPPGSMGPKVLAAIRFVENGGKFAVIGHLYKALETLRGETGTRIVPG